MSAFHFVGLICRLNQQNAKLIVFKILIVYLLNAGFLSFQLD